jgi:dTDP-4-dehydrorhamnose 3,5-epimerase
MIGIERLDLDGLFLIRPRRVVDHRGSFCETYNRRDLAQAGISMSFVQDNESHSAKAGTIRGIHYQLRPYSQAKLIRVLRGAILDVIVDLRIDSPSFGRHVALRLDAAEPAALLVPTGFGHAMCTLEDDTIVLYKVSQLYSAQHDRGLAWDDPALAIDWPVVAEAAVLSDKDRRLPRLADVPRSELFALDDSETTRVAVVTAAAGAA